MKGVSMRYYQNPKTITNMPKDGRARMFYKAPKGSVPYRKPRVA